jgi:hypothetical protein
VILDSNKKKKKILTFDSKLWVLIRESGFEFETRDPGFEILDPDPKCSGYGSEQKYSGRGTP